jgi:large subunit ribosomal protein L31
MREKIHPKWYPEARVTCSCGNTWTTGATVPEIRTDVCSNCHPFYTGEQRIVDTEGQVDRFYKRLERRSTIEVEAEEARARTTVDLSVRELGLTQRATNSLERAGVSTVGQLLEKLGQGDEAALAIEGFGRQSLLEAKKKLRARGFSIASGVEKQPAASVEGDGAEG